jgi:hypothetical protein
MKNGLPNIHKIYKVIDMMPSVVGFNKKIHELVRIDGNSKLYADRRLNRTQFFGQGLKFDKTRKIGSYKLQSTKEILAKV